MIIDTCTDLEIHVGIDGFLTAVLQEGTWTDVSLKGTIFQGGDPIPVGQPFVVSFQGTYLVNCDFAIRGISAYTSNYWYGSNTTPTLVSMSGCSFLFNTVMSALVLSLDFTNVAGTPIFNCSMDGNTDSPTNTLEINGVAMTSGQYRLFVNGLRTGTA